jgi:thiol-disulfide isomerase/thioredoxin
MRALLLSLATTTLALAVVACKPAPPAAARSAPAAPVSTAESPSSGTNALFARAGFDIPTSPINATDFTLESLEGRKVSLSSFKGKLVVLSFWATWCVPCQEEMPAMQTLYDALRGKGLEIVAVDVMEDKATVAKFRKDHGYTFPILLDSGGAIAGTYGAQGIPTNYVIDRNGRVLARVVGVGGPGWTSAEMKALFDRLLLPS